MCCRCFAGWRRQPGTWYGAIRNRFIKLCPQYALFLLWILSTVGNFYPYFSKKRDSGNQCNLNHSSLTGITGIPVDGPSRCAPVIRGQEIPAAPPGPPHATSGAVWFHWTILAFGDFVGAAAADSMERGPEGDPFGKGGSQPLFENPRDGVLIAMAHQAGIESAGRREVWVFYEGTAILADRFTLPPFQCGHGSYSGVKIPETGIPVVPLQQSKVLFHPWRRHQGRFRSAPAQDHGTGGNRSDAHAVGKVEQSGYFIEVVAHLREKKRNPSGKPFPHEHFDSMQSATEGAFPPDQIVSSGRNPVETDLKRKTGEVKFSQGRHLLSFEEHGVGLESDGFKSE
jgi:hypothetical protein